MQDSSNLIVILRNYSGAIVIALLVVLYSILTTLYERVKKKLSGQFWKLHTLPQVSINSPIALTKETDSQYIRIRYYGSSSIIIKNADLATKILNNADIFESYTFTSQTFNLSLNLLGISQEKKNLKNLLNAVLRTRMIRVEESFTDAVLENFVEYPIHSNKLEGQTKVVIPLTLANNKKKPYSPKLYPSLETNGSSDTEIRAEEEYSSSQAVGKSTSKIDTNKELLLPERFVEQKEHRALKKCDYNISEPFTLMKVQTDHLNGSDARVMNSNNTLITQQSTVLNANEKLINIQPNIPQQFESCFLLLKYPIKELIVLLEAKSNRRNTININLFSYRHAVNTLGVCLFGKRINQLTSSRSQFYQICDHLIEILQKQQKHKLVQYFNELQKYLQPPKEPNHRVRKIVEFFNTSVNDCLAGRYEGDESSLINVLFRQLGYDLDSQSESYEQVKGKEKIKNCGSISAFLISFTINVLEILSGSMSLIIRQLAKDVESQEKIRTNDKVEFNLEGFPFLNLENSAKWKVTDSIIEEALESHAVDPIRPVICKYPYRIPETEILVNPTCVILIPRHVLPKSQQIDCKGKCPERATPPGSFIVDLETQSFNLFVKQFVDMCLKLSLTSLLQQYIFTIDDTCANQDDETANTSCRFTTLPKDIFVTVNRVDKRGKVITFEESLKAFHAMKNAPLSWRTILSKCSLNTALISS